MNLIEFSAGDLRLTLEWSPIGVTSLKILGLKSKGESKESKGTRLTGKKALENGNVTEIPDFVDDAMRNLRDYLRRGEACLAPTLCRAPTFQADIGNIRPFSLVVLETLRSVPRGKVISYGVLAGLVGKSMAARAVASVMRWNPLPLLYPCHRVVAGDLSLCGFSGGGGVEMKKYLLILEGVSFKSDGTIYSTCVDSGSLVRQGF